MKNPKMSRDVRGKKNPNYKHGRYIENKCKNCNELIDGRSVRCNKCRAIFDNPFGGKQHTKKTKDIIGKKSKEKWTEEYKEKHRRKHKGKKHRTINGYTLIKNYIHPNRNSQNEILEHILIMSNHLNRPIKKGEIIHHINGDRSNNKISNLYLYKNRSNHHRAVSSMLKLIGPLLEKNIIIFLEGEYKLRGDEL